MGHSRRRQRRDHSAGSRAAASTSGTTKPTLAGRITSRLAGVSNVFVASDEQLGELFGQVLGASQLPCRDDLQRVRRQLAHLRRTLLDLDAALDDLE